MELRSNEPTLRRLNGQVEIQRPPLRVACSYLITAWPIGGTDLALARAPAAQSGTAGALTLPADSCGIFARPTRGARAAATNDDRADRRAEGTSRVLDGHRQQIAPVAHRHGDHRYGGLRAGDGADSDYRRGETRRADGAGCRGHLAAYATSLLPHWWESDRREPCAGCGCDGYAGGYGLRDADHRPMAATCSARYRPAHTPCVSNRARRPGMSR